ncbi:hypothetical protein lerEdw1_020291 [Lerista edwardsae]|nr:hypothetical protein lerEdw1_020291 [Lerista edwardsae]
MSPALLAVLLTGEFLICAGECEDGEEGDASPQDNLSLASDRYDKDDEGPSDDQADAFTTQIHKCRAKYRV